MSAPRIRHHLNVRLALVLTALGLAASLGVYFLRGYQEDRILGTALAQVRGFRTAAEREKDPERRARDYDLALRHVSQYVATRPDDPAGLEIQADLLLKTGGIDGVMGAIRVYEHLLRLPPDRLDPGGRTAQEPLRRLADLDIKFSTWYLGLREAKLQPENTASLLKFHAAELLTDQLLDPAAVPRVDDAEAHRLRAMALEGQIVPGNTYRPLKNKEGRVVLEKDKGGNVVTENGRPDGKPVEAKIELRDYAIMEYRAALERDPGDLAAAWGLAALYKEQKDDPIAAKKVLDDVLNSRSGSASVEARLARYEFFRRVGDPGAAAAELNKAAEQAPKDIRVIMTAAVDALDVKDTAVARDWLDRLPKDLGDVGVRIRVLYLRGLVEYLDQNPEEAIGAWKKGLELSGGTDPDLTWRLAAAEFEQGRDAEAKELADQFRRLAGDDSPSLWWLETLQDERAKRYDRAIERLEKMLSKRSNISVNLQEHGLMTLGRCLEKVNLPLKAEKAYREVLEIAPKSLAARLACAQLLCGEKKPEEAAVVLEQGLEFHPKNPTLLMALTSTRLQQQMARPADRRSWTSFDAIYRRASAEARQNPLLDLMLADRLAANNQMDEAVKVLKDGVARDPKSVDFARGLAEYLSRQGQTDQALQVLDRASAPEAVGDRGALRLLRARILNALGRGREARAVLVRDVDKVPEDDRDELWNALVLLCQAHGDPVASRDACAEWARQLPDDVPPKFMRLELAIQANDESEVRRSFAELDPSKKKGGAGEQDNNLWRLAHARVLLWEHSRLKEKDAKAGKLLAEAGNLVEAVLAKPQSNLVALLLQGLIREEEGNPKGAIESYKLAWSAGRPEALIRLIDLQTRPDPEDDNHEEELRQLWKSDPTKELDRLVAIACFRNRDREQALRVVRESLGGNPDLAFRVVKESPGEYHEAKTWQAEMFEQLGKFQEAEAVLRKMAEQQPERLERWLALVRHQAAHGGSSAATKTIEDVKLRFKNDRPELLEAQCRTAAGDRPGADKAFEAAIRRYPDDRDVLLYAERYFEGMGRFDRAEACLKRLLERDPNDHPAARQLAILLSGRPESWPQALAVLGPEGPKNDTAEDRLARGVVLVRSADAAQQRRGTDLLTALVADLPAENNVAIMARDVLVRLLLATGQAAQASQVAATSATTGSDPNAVALYVETLIQSGHYDVAEAQIDRLVKLGVSGQSEANLRVRLIQGRSLQERAAPAKSAAALEQAYLARADTAEGEAYGREIFPMLVAMGPDAREVAERLARRLARKSPPLSWMPALILARQGNRDEALALCRTAAQAGKDPADLREAGRIALEVSVAARLQASALEQAGEVLDMALRNSPDFDDLLVMRAMVDHLQSRFDEEARLYRAVLSHQPEHPVVLNNLAWVLSEGLDQTREALDKIDLLIKLAGRRAENLDTRGVILSRMGRLDEAIKDLEEVARAEPTGVHFYHLAQAYRKAGRDAESRKAFEKARQAGLNAETLDPTERAAFEAMRSL